MNDVSVVDSTSPRRPRTTVITVSPHSEARAATRRRRGGASLDRLVASDPGLKRFRDALGSVLTIALALGAEWLFVHVTHALEIPTHGVALSAAAAVRVGAANHDFRVVAMVLGAVVGLISSVGVMDRTAKGQLVTMLLMPVPMVSALALGIAIGGQRTIALVVLVVVLAAGTYCRRFGPRGSIVGILLFVGDLMGFFLHAAVTISDLGWLTAEIGVGLLVAMVVRFALFYPRPAKALARTQRSYAARARTVAVRSLELFDDPEHDERRVHRLQHHLVRLNEAALMIDAQLGDPNALADASTSGELIHQRLFDVELALTNVARLAQALGRRTLSSDQRDRVRGALVGITGGDGDRAKADADAILDQLRDGGGVPADQDPRTGILLHRFAGTVIDLADAIAAWTTLCRSGGVGEGTFRPSVTLLGGWLPGSSQVSAAASLEPGARRGDRSSLAPYTRTAIQIGAAVGAAIVFGDVLSQRRFYWAVISVFIVFTGTFNSGEQIHKAAHRVIGTVVGIAVGSLIVKLIGHHSGWAIVAILASLFMGLYLIRISYAFMAIAITVMVSQLYVQLDEFSSSLLLLRLEETAIGAAVAVAAATLVLPLRTRRVLRVALRGNVQALTTLVTHATNHLLGDRHDGEGTLRGDARALDASFQALLATAQPLERNLFGVDEDIRSAIRHAAASRNYARNLIAYVDAVDELDDDTRSDIEQAGETLRRSLDVLVGALNGPRDASYTRSSSLFDRAEQRLESDAVTRPAVELALHDLKLIDQTMASMAELMNLAIADYDTVDTAPTNPPEQSLA